MASTAIAQNRVGMELTLQLISQDIASNTSVVRRRGRVWRNSGTGIWGSGASWSASEAGGGAGGSFGYDFRSTYEYVLMVQDFTVYHNADGTAGITSRFDVNMNNTSYPGGGTVWESMTLPTIPRASTPSWSGNFEAGTAKTINMNRASSSFTHTVQYFFGSASGTIATGVTDSVSWTPPLSLLQQIPNSASGTGTLRVITDGIGTKDVAFTLVAPATAVPTINAPTITEDNSAVATVMGAGVYVQKLSSVKAVVSGSGYQNSTISAAEFTIGGVTAASGGTITPQTSGTVAVSSKVTDSRGRTATRSDNITVRAYSTPTINNLLVSRATSAGVVANEGTYLRVDLNAAVSSLVNGTEKNTLGIRVFTRLKGATTWTARNVINHSALTYNTNFLISGGDIAPVNQAFEVRVEVFDKFGTAAGQTLIATAAIYMNWATGGIGVGKYWEKGAIDAVGSIHSTQGFYTDSVKVITDLGAALQDGKYYAAAGATGAPFATSEFIVQVNNLGNGRVVQEARMGTTSRQVAIVWTRTWNGSTWSNWWRSDGLLETSAGNLVNCTYDPVTGRYNWTAGTTSVEIKRVLVGEFRAYRILYQYYTGDNNGNWFRFMQGATSIASNYAYNVMYSNGGSMASSSISGASRVGIAAISAPGHFGEINISEPMYTAGAANQKCVWGRDNAYGIGVAVFGGHLVNNDAQALNGIQFSLSNTGMNTIHSGSHAWLSIQGVA